MSPATPYKSSSTILAVATTSLGSAIFISESLLTSTVSLVSTNSAVVSSTFSVVDSSTFSFILLSSVVTSVSASVSASVSSTLSVIEVVSASSSS